MSDASKTITRERPVSDRFPPDTGVIYFNVPPGQEHHCDGKKLFRLGATEHEAYAEYARRLGRTAATASGRTLAAVLDRYMREVSPGKAPRSHLNDTRAVGRIRHAFGHFPLTQPVEPHDAYSYLVRTAVAAWLSARAKGTL